MTIRRVEDLGPQIGSLWVVGALSVLTDAQLLERFATERGLASSLAFEVLVERHGPMVLRVCRSVLGDLEDAQDAFQATFLVLVRKAASIRDRDSVASWLHGVAVRVARHVRATEARRRRLESARETRQGVDSRTDLDDIDDDLGPKLHEEVGRLPERYRVAVVLCYLEGHTCEDAARVLRWPVGTVKSRLFRARERLRKRLTRLGLAPVVVPLSAPLASSTACLAARYQAGSSAPALVLAHPAVSLAEGVLKAMTLAKLKSTALGLFLILGASAVGINAAMPAVGPAQEPDRRSLVEPASKPQTTAPDPVALMVPRDLEITAGSGTALVYELTRDGSRILVKPDGPFKVTEANLRWVAIIGTLDDQAIRKAQAQARKIDLSATNPNYKRLEVQRQDHKPGQAWSEWTNLDYDKNYAVLDHLPELTRESVLKEFRPEALVDPLPRLKTGTWDGINPVVTSWKELSEMRIEASKKPPRMILPQKVMLRSLDFTVEPGTTYRYRVRVVSVNPDKDMDGKRELFGPWSEPTPEATAR